MSEDPEFDAWAHTCAQRVAEVATALPGVVEEDAWVGVRWRIRGRTFAHCYPVRDGRPQGSAATAGVEEPAVLLTLRAAAADAAAFAHLGLPYFKPPWSSTAAGVVLDAHTDWDEVVELVTESYCERAPLRLARQVRPHLDG